MNTNKIPTKVVGKHKKVLKESTNEYQSKCCNSSKCTCTSFLWKGVNVDLGSSDEGMYGETREKSLRNVFRIMSKYGMDENSILLDIGSGRGVPNIVASYQLGIFSSIGIELDEKAYCLSLSNVLYTLNDQIQKYTEYSMENNANNNKAKLNETQEKNARNCVNDNLEFNEIFLKEKIYKHKDNSATNFEEKLRRRIGFFRGDATSLDKMEPVSHIYSFDAAMPAWMVKKFVDLFNESTTSFCYVSYRKDLIESLGLRGIKLHGISTQMAGSGEGRMCWLYVKENWQDIKKKCDFLIKEKYFTEVILSINKLSNVKNLESIIQITCLDINKQKQLINDALSEWYNSRKSRKECIAERKLMNQRHKILKQLFIQEKQNKLNINQLTLKDVGIVVTKSDSKVRNNTTRIQKMKPSTPVSKSTSKILRHPNKNEDSSNISIDSVSVSKSEQKIQKCDEKVKEKKSLAHNDLQNTRKQNISKKTTIAK
ncbi:hypothetical protein cand_006750 [Cryptosporidium andersoni]|uniref:DOT1 domain-containing protein n=1 Tax=Cryptosporidium andersoni TaxID=117008 RepID=A0A1J4MTQ7_9CRYT|nr:hypothetical protein cand_006750 [Cryptosporidium andersoni]